MTTQWRLLQCVNDHVTELLQHVDEHAREVITVCHTKRARDFLQRVLDFTSEVITVWRLLG